MLRTRHRSGHPAVSIVKMHLTKHRTGRHADGEKERVRVRERERERGRERKRDSRREIVGVKESWRERQKGRREERERERGREREGEI